MSDYSKYFVDPQDSEIFDCPAVKDAVSEIRSYPAKEPFKSIIVITEKEDGTYDTDTIAFPVAAVPPVSTIDAYRTTTMYRELEDHAERDVLAFPEPYRTICLLSNVLSEALGHSDSEFVGQLVGMLFSVIPDVEILGIYIDFAQSNDTVDLKTLLKFSFLQVVSSPTK